MALRDRQRRPNGTVGLACRVGAVAVAVTVFWPLGPVSSPADAAEAAPNLAGPAPNPTAGHSTTMTPATGGTAAGPGGVAGRGGHEPTVVPALAGPGRPGVETLVAAASVRKVSVFAEPGAAKPVLVLDSRANFSRRTVFVVVGHQPGWYRVMVPRRPNGRTGWVKSSEIGLFTTPYSIAVSLSRRELVLYRNGVEELRERVAIGQPRYPTPTGVFFITEGVRPSNPKGAYGTFAFGLSGYSNVLTRFGRGDGQIGIHGTNAPAQLGQAVSHGCIRMRNEAVSKLAKLLPQGVPVVVEP
jgi:lipoprotein-anchoring transpeptidase ErfK/SrfK